MKKLIIGSVILVGLVGAAVWGIPRLRLSNPWLDGKWEDVKPGNLVIPVRAEGEIHPNQLVEIKSKASGEVKEILVREGEMVQKGTVLVRLDPVDEQRNLERADAEYERAKAAHATAQVRLREAQDNGPLNIAIAKARVDQLQAQVDQAALQVQKLANVGLEHKTDLEVKLQQTQLDNAKATLDQAKGELSRTQNSVPLAIETAKHDVTVAKAIEDAAEKAVEDAKQRLTETTITAPTDGMVYAIRVKSGEIVQSGKTSLTGGTPLMYIADVSKMYVIAQVDEADIGQVRNISPEFARPGTARQVSAEELLQSAPLPPSSETGKESPATMQAEDVAKADVVTGTMQGRRVRVEIEAYPEEEFEGIIERILPEPRAASTVTTFAVKIWLRGQDLPRLLGLQQADVVFTANRLENVLLVKNEAIVTKGEDSFVYTPYREREKDPWDEKEVVIEIGLTDGTYTHVRSGLHAGDRIWTKRPVLTDREKEKKKSS